MKHPVTRYHPALITLHWLLAVLILATLIIGFFVLADMPNTDPSKISILRLHMIVGMVIFALMVARLIVRIMTSRPADATTGFRSLDRLAPVTHYAFYILVLLMVGTGLSTAKLSGLTEIVFGNSGEPLPADLMVYPTFVGHIIVATIFVGLIGLHVLGALYHQFVRKDGLLTRMQFGSRDHAYRLRSDRTNQRPSL